MEAEKAKASIYIEIPNQDYDAVIEYDEERDEVKTERRHGTVILACGALPEAGETLIPLYADPEGFAKPAIWEPFDKFRLAWEKILRMRDKFI